MSKFTNTGNIIVDEAFRNWIGSGNVPGNIEFGEMTLGALFANDRQKLIDHINCGDFRCDLFRNRSDMTEECNQIDEWVKNLETLEKWQLVYLVLALDNQGIIRKNSEGIKSNMWDLIDSHEK